MEYVLILFFSFLVEAIIAWQYAESLFTPKYTIRSRILLLGTLYFILFLFSLLQQPYLNLLLFCVANILFLYIPFKITLPLAFFHSLILTAIMAMSELAPTGIIMKLFPHFFRTDTLGLALYGIISKSIFFIIVYLATILLKPKDKQRENFDRSCLFLILIPISSIFVMFTFLATGEVTSYVFPITAMINICAILLLLSNLLVFGIHQYNQKKSQEFTEMQLMLQKEADATEYYEMLLSQYENQKILIHDLKKHLQSIELLNAKGEREKIKAYIKSLLNGSDLQESARICDDAMLNAILSRYQHQCKEKEISFHADIRSNTLTHLRPNDLTSLFCNLLDNAVEAAEHIPDSFIELTAQKKEPLPFVVLVLINSCRIMPKCDPDGYPISNKPDKTRHGFGIKSIRKVVKQYQGDMQMYYDTDSATFHTIITLKQ